ncbi:MAG: hypothetical protein Q8K98_05370 [Bacteroidota bacterium]|nr:hypothetical protein [Bacteroidota bacterium]
MLYKKMLYLFVFLISVSGCSSQEQKISESEKRIIELAVQTSDIILQVEASETRYARKKQTKEWKTAYNTKRHELDSLLQLLDSKIQEARFIEQMPEEKTKILAEQYLHAVENIKMYITTTNADLTRFFSTAPPAHDPFNWKKFVEPAKQELNKISGIAETKPAETSGRSKSEDRGRYFLHGPDGDATNRTIQRAPEQADSWKEAVESAEKGIQKK